MSETLRPGGEGMRTPLESQNVAPTTMTGWVGWVAFAGIMMVLLGSFHVIQGLIALFNDDYYLVTKNGLAVNFDFTTWGWVHLIGGCIVVAAGVCVFLGQIWARSVGVVVAMVSAAQKPFVAVEASPPCATAILPATCSSWRTWARYCND